MHYTYDTKGVCASKIEYDVEAGKIKNVAYFGGCKGNLQAVSRLVEGMDVQEAIKKLSGIQCGSKSTSCADQLAKTLAANS